jgi:hypothetical protein
VTKKTDAKKIADLEYEIAGLKTLLKVASEDQSPWSFIKNCLTEKIHPEKKDA